MLTRKLFSPVSRLFSPSLPPETPVWYHARLTMFAGGMALLFYFLLSFRQFVFSLSNLVLLKPISYTQLRDLAARLREA